MSVIDSFFVALGFKTDTKGLEAFEKKAYSVKDSILSMGSVITAAVAGFAVRGIAQIGSTFEQNKIQIAGFLSGLGMSSDFNAGLKDADKTIQSITKAAARLPGEAEDYIQVFKTALPFVQAALPGGSIEQITDFTNQLTAVGKTFGIDAATIGHEADMLLGPQGRASVRFPLFVQLQSFMRKIPGQAKLTAESFNLMTQPKRLQLMADAFKLLQPMLDASATSFDAMWGAAVSGFKKVARLTTAPLFDGMKEALDRLNASFFDANGELTEFGKGVVETGKFIGRAISRTLTMVVQIVAGLGKMRGVTLLLKVAFAALAPVLAGLAFNRLASKIEGVIGALLKLNAGTILSTFLIGLMAASVFLIGEDLWTFFNDGDSVTGRLIERFGDLGLAIAVFAAIAAAAWLVAFAPVAAILVGLGLLAKAIADISAHWEAFKILVTKLPIAKIKDMMPGMENEHFADQVRAEAGAAWEQRDKRDADRKEGDAREAARADREARGISGPGPWSPDYNPGGAFSMVPNTSSVEWQKWEPPSAGGRAAAPADNRTSVHVDKVEINTNDPEKMGKEFSRRVIRNHQSKVGR